MIYGLEKERKSTDNAEKEQQEMEGGENEYCNFFSCSKHFLCFTSLEFSATILL